MNQEYFNIRAIPALKDNYIWSIETDQGAIIIDPGDAEPVLKYLASSNQTCIAILITHHHYDHTGGVDALYANDPRINIYGPDNLPIKSPYFSIQSEVNIAGNHFKVLYIPGHTLDHIAYYDGKHLFVGDTLFSGGCGRVFEGSNEQMLKSLDIICTFPDETIVFCAHEYTLNNLKFALFVEPDNLDIKRHMEIIAQKTISLPTSIALEKKINPFLRLNEPNIQANLQSKSYDTNTRLNTFSALRKLKDEF